MEHNVSQMPAILLKTLLSVVKHIRHSSMTHVCSSERSLNYVTKMVHMLQLSTCEEQRSVVPFLWAKGHKPSEIHRDMRGVYGDDCMDRSNVSRWCTFFQEGRVNLSDSPRSGRPTAATPQNVRGIETAILNDRRVQLRALSQKFNISYGAVYDIVHENLKFCKVSSRWVPKNLTYDHKGQQIMASLDHLTRYTAQGHDFLEGIVTGDESPTKIKQHFSAPHRWTTVACASSLLHSSSFSR
ncbi:hypothetical protein C0J52_17541 [Blattella germanica]|nr:hypothetical protein C0J52_17541 [Blattella germanica]